MIYTYIIERRGSEPADEQVEAVTPEQADERLLERLQYAANNNIIRTYKVFRRRPASDSPFDLTQYMLDPVNLAQYMR